MKKVLIVIGSDSDYEKMKPALKFLSDFGIGFSMDICSAHRSPEKCRALAETAESKGFGVIIAGAGLAAALPGALAANTCLPVIGVPLNAGSLGGVDALLSEVQMPSGVPVAVVAINASKNAALLAAQILAVSDKELYEKLMEYKENMKKELFSKSDKLKERLEADGFTKGE